MNSKRKTLSNLISITLTFATFVIAVSCKDAEENGEKIIVYVAGTDGAIATLWENGKARPLDDNTNNAFAESAYVFDNDIYVAGYKDFVATLWKNREAQPLDDTVIIAHLVFVSDSNVYSRFIHRSKYDTTHSDGHPMEKQQGEGAQQYYKTHEHCAFVLYFEQRGALRLYIG
jgi:hypothetical protein